MIAATFDTLKYAKQLKEAGVPEKQAEIQAEALKEVVDNNLATKQDIIDLKHDIKDLEYKLTIRMGAFAVAIITILAAIIKL